MGSIDGNNWVKLRPLKTEGVSYRKTGFASPTGGGVIITALNRYRFGLVQIIPKHSRIIWMTYPQYILIL